MKKAYSTREWLVLIIILVIMSSFILPNLSKNGESAKSFLECEKQGENHKCSLSQDLLIKANDITQKILKKVKELKNTSED